MRWFASLILSGVPLLSVWADPVPADFASPQSPTKPAPFKVEYVDQGKFDPKLKGILAPDGFKVEIVADYPQVVNPVGMTFGPDGTPFVLEWATDPTSNGSWFEFKEVTRYRDGSTRQIATMKKFVLDPCKQFSIDPKTGKFEQPRIIFTDELPSTLLYHDGWLYTASRGTVRRFRQSRPGGPWDIREVIAQGFCGFHHHQVSGLTIGNDGLLYITSGDDDNVVEGSDGSRATVMRTGAVFRCKPDGSQMEMYSLGYRNPYRDLSFDDKFNWFHVDNDNEDGSKFTGCRLMHVAEGADYGWRLKIGARCCQPDHLRGAVAGELPGKLSPMLKTGRGSPAGLLIYHDTKLPEQYRGLAFYPDVFRKLIRAYRFAEKDSTFAVSHEFEFMKSDDPLFRPCQMVTGPDGAIYCVDWRANSGGAGKLWGDNEHGRIYRITFTGSKTEPGIHTRPLDSWAKILRQSDAELIATLGAPDLTDRVIARNELIRRGPTAQKLVRSEYLAGKVPAKGRYAALGVIQQVNDEETRKLLIKLLDDEDRTVRRIATEAIGQIAKSTDDATWSKLIARLRDTDPAVRRVAAHAVARVTNDASSILAAWKSEDSKDPFLMDAYLRGIERCNDNGVNALLTLAESGNGADFDRAVTAFAGMRTNRFGTAAMKLLANPHASEGQRIALLRSLPNYENLIPLSLEPVAKWLVSTPKLSATERTVGLNTLIAGEGLTNAWGTKLVLSMLSSDSQESRLAALAAVDSIKLKDAAPTLLEWIVDAKRPPEERTAAIKALRSVGDAKMADPILAQMKGTAPSYLKVELLRTAMAFNPELTRKTAVSLLEQTDRGLLNEAVGILGTTKEGAKLIGERFADNKLPKELLQRVADSIRNFSGNDPALASLYDRVMRGGLKLSPADVAKLSNLVASRGNAARGKELYLNSTTLACITCHRMEGVGGQVGPDLTRLWDTMTVEKILESILEPSKEIKEGYQSYKAVTNAGAVYTGLRVSESNTEVVLRESTGRDIRIAKTDLDTLTTSKISLMPENAISQLSYDQLIDLIAFLRNRREQESLRGIVREFRVATDPKSTGTIKAVESNGSLNWKSTQGTYASIAVWSASDQTGSLSIVTDDAVELSIAGQTVFQRTAPKAGGFMEPESIPMIWKAGWNTITVKLIQPGAVNRLTLKAIGEGLRTAAVPEK